MHVFLCFKSFHIVYNISLQVAISPPRLVFLQHSYFILFYFIWLASSTKFIRVVLAINTASFAMFKALLVAFAPLFFQ